MIENKEEITAFDDPSYTKKFKSKAVHATTTTCRVFEFLLKNDLPVAYITQLSDTEFLSPKCEMIPLECVVRRYAVGSYLKRKPEFMTPEGEKPHRFEELVFELFLKTSGGGKLEKNGEILLSGLPKDKDGKQIEDPIIKRDMFGSRAVLYDTKLPVKENNSLASVDLMKILKPSAGFESFTKESKNEMQKMIKSLTLKAFKVLEHAWAELGYTLIDMKIEFGITEAGQLLIADVIDNDSWRLKDQDFAEISKQIFRNGASLSKVEDVYAEVAKLVGKF